MLHLKVLLLKVFSRLPGVLASQLKVSYKELNMHCIEYKPFYFLCCVFTNGVQHFHLKNWRKSFDSLLIKSVWQPVSAQTSVTCRNKILLYSPQSYDAIMVSHKTQPTKQSSLCEEYNLHYIPGVLNL